MSRVRRVAAQGVLAASVGLGSAPANAEGRLDDELPRQASDQIAPARGSSAHGGGYADTRGTSPLARSGTTLECTELCEAEADLNRMRACMIECVETFGIRPEPSSGSVFIGAGLLATALGAAALVSGLAGICNVTAGPAPDAPADPECEVTALASGAGLLVLGPLLALIGIEQASPFGASPARGLSWAF